LAHTEGNKSPVVAHRSQEYHYSNSMVGMDVCGVLGRTRERAAAVSKLSGALMPNAHRPCYAAIASWGRLSAAATLAVFMTGPIALAQNARVEDLVSAVVRIKTHVNPEGRTVEGLGREREGSGIIIDNDGLVLTIGYLMVEAYAAEVVDNSGHTVPANVVGYDHESGFGLLRTMEPLKLKPMPLGKSADVKERDPVLVASFGGTDMVAGALGLASTRTSCADACS
jgi:S1-C subfamily serine protease